MCVNICFVYVPVIQRLSDIKWTLSSIRRTEQQKTKTARDTAWPPPPPTHQFTVVCFVREAPSRWSQLLDVSVSMLMKGFVVLGEKMVRSFLMRGVRLCECVWDCVCVRDCVWACIDGCVHVAERDRIPFILGVNPQRLLWRFLKGISWGHRWGVRRQLFFPASGPNPQSLWSEAGWLCVWFQHRRYYMYTTKYKVIVRRRLWSR